MGVMSLSSSQQAAVDQLVAAHRIEKVPVDASRAAAFLASASDRLSQLPLLTSAGVQYDIAYDAAHDVGEALLAAYGYRTRSGSGQHEALGRFLKAVVSDPPADAAARRFDQLRRTRNQIRYAAQPVGRAEAALAESTARSLHGAAAQLGVGS